LLRKRGNFASKSRPGLLLLSLSGILTSNNKKAMTSQSSETKKTTGVPEPEVLKPQVDEAVPAQAASTPAKSPLSARRAHRTYRPSHKATFIGATVVVGILILNAGILALVMRTQANADSAATKGDVTISSDALDKLGVSRSPIGSFGAELTVNPNARFNGKVTIAKDVEVAGQLKLNSRFSASDASLTKLQAGKTAVQELNVNGDATASTLNLRKDLSVVGTTRLQGPVIMNQLLSVNNHMNVIGNLSVGGALSVRTLHVSSLVSDTTLTIGGHIMTQGSAPSAGPGSALGSNGTISISGNDTAGTVAANIGVGGGNGTLAQVAFRQQYGNTPRVVVSAVGRGAPGLYVSRTSAGFTIGVSGSLSPGGYAFDYIVMQ
jgi:hypothetical protein